MIQRVQTIFLFLVAVLLVIFNFLPYWQSSSNNNILMSYAYLINEGDNSMIEFGIYTTVAILSCISILIAVVEIFMFKNRVRQMVMSLINSFIMMTTIGLMSYFIYGLQESMSGEFGLGAFILAIAMFMNLLARKFIQKDENLTRSVNRIR